MRKQRSWFAALGLLGLFLYIAGCDSADNPVAPSGSVLTVSANPTRISLNGQSTITVIGFRPDGNPLSNGTLINLSTDLGVLAQTPIEVTGNGRASTTLSGDGTSGTAMINASLPGSGGGEGGGAGSTTVQIGESAETSPKLSISASPSIIGLDESAEISAIARNSDDSPFGSGGSVTLRTSLGTLRSGFVSCTGSGNSSIVVETDASSEAKATLCAGDQPGTASITGMIGSSASGSMTTATATVTIEVQSPNLTISANPDNIDSGEESTITIFARDNNNVPLGAGFEIQLTSTLGLLSDETPTTDSNGRAQSFLTTNGEVGTATVSAFLGSSTVESTTVALRDEVTALSLQATPTEVQRSSNVEQTFDLVAIARNPQNDPVGGESLSFETSFGQLNSRGSVVLTNNQGEATDTLRFSPDEAANIPVDVTDVVVTVTAGDISAEFPIKVVE